MDSGTESIKQGHPMFIIAMGASGCGKSTLGQALANSLGIQFLDGDDLHPKANIEKMALGHPLTDEDRYPWLELIRAKAEQVCADKDSSKSAGCGVVIACSALKKAYRDILRGKTTTCHVPQQIAPLDTLPTYFVYLKGSRDTLLRRMEDRKGHFMKSNMLDSQLQTLESPEGEEGVVVINIEGSTTEQVRSAREGLSSLVEF
ncbi:hypothetical protein BGZ80_011688 [Entomortierella chlamydospora]|uniref:Gluconokinase n=1 Tax=Entomortierella chlamydospora TaxID=101097 RepID=A0A9P6SYY7_9FUNG|nr:hypothetical protein BGZ80_011688 [Entomortierella chlamydospora]